MASTFQAQVQSVVPERFRLPRVFTALALVEELGEFVYAASRQDSMPLAISDELGDLFFSCAEIANEYAFSLSSDSSTDNLPHDTHDDHANLVILTGQIAKCVLEIECFEHSAHIALANSVRGLFLALSSFARSNALNVNTILDNSLEKMQSRVASGKWETAYGDTLWKKRVKHN